jgi:hypothetical protein
LFVVHFHHDLHECVLGKLLLFPPTIRVTVLSLSLHSR